MYEEVNTADDEIEWADGTASSAVEATPYQEVEVTDENIEWEETPAVVEEVEETPREPTTYDKIVDKAKAVGNFIKDSVPHSPSIILEAGGAIKDEIESYTDPAKNPKIVMQRIEELHNTSVMWEESDSKTLDNMRKDMTETLAQYGIEVITQTDAEGNVQRFFKAPNGKPIPYTASALRSIFNAKSELVMGTGGALRGASLGARAPLPPLGRAITAGGGAILGGALGSGTGAVVDQVFNSYSSQLKLEELEIYHKFKKAAVEDAVFGVVGGTVVNIGKHLLKGSKGRSLEYLTEKLYLNKKEAKELYDLYTVDPEKGYKAISQRALELAEQGGPEGVNFLKTAMRTDPEAGKAYLNTATQRVEAMVEAVESNELKGLIENEIKTNLGNYKVVNWNSLSKKVQSLVRNGKIELSSKDIALVDGMKNRHSSVESQVADSAYSGSQLRTATTMGGMYRTNFEDAIQANIVGKAFHKILDVLAPEVRKNTAAVKLIQDAVKRSTDPVKLLTSMSQGKGDIAKIAKELLKSSRASAELGGQAAPTGDTSRTPTGGSTDAGYPKAKEEPLTEKEQIAADNALVEKADSEMAEGILDQQERAITAKEEGDTLIARADDATATSKMAESESIGTTEALAKQKKVAELHNEKIAKINYSANKYDLNVEKKAVADAEKQAKQADKEITKIENDIQKAQGKEKAQLIKDKKVVQRVRDKFEKSASDYIVKLRKLADKAKKTGKKEDVEVITEEIKQVSSKIEGSLKAKKAGEQGMDVVEEKFTDGLSDRAKEEFPELKGLDLDEDEVGIYNKQVEQLDELDSMIDTKPKASYKEGGIVTAEPDPSIVPYKQSETAKAANRKTAEAKKATAKGQADASSKKGDTPKQAEAERLKNTITSEDELTDALQGHNFAKSQEPIQKESKSVIAERESMHAEEQLYKQAEEEAEAFGVTVEEALEQLKVKGLIPSNKAQTKAKDLLDKALSKGATFSEASEIYERSIGRSAFSPKESGRYTRWMRKNPTKVFHHYAKEHKLDMKTIESYYSSKGGDIPITLKGT